MMLSPLILWLLAFVVAPTAILLVYSFGVPAEVGHGKPQLNFLQGDFSQTLDSYGRIFRPKFAPVLWEALLVGLGGSVVVGGLFAIARWVLDARPRRKTIIAGMAWTFVLAACVSLHFTVPDVSRIGDLNVTNLQCLWRSVEYAAFTTVICLIVGYPVAFFIGRCTPAWRNRLLMLIMIPFWTSFLIRTYAWITILREGGLLNSLLLNTGIIHQPLELFYSPFSVTIGLLYNFLPFMILPIYGSVEKLDNALVEAAQDLGARPIRTFLSVILPLTAPGIAAGVLLVFVPAIGMYAIYELMGGSKIVSIGTVIEKQFIGQGDNIPFGSALGMTVLVLFAAAYMLSVRRSPSTK